MPCYNIKNNKLNFKICSIGANIDNKKNDKKQIRNSTVDFLVFTKEANENGIEVRIQDGTVVTAFVPRLT